MSSDAVNKATGRTWPQWLALLDKAGCASMNHRQIVAVVEKQRGVGPWWRQMVAVGYEQARGLRDKHQKPSGYEISASRTINAPAYKVYLSWTRKACMDQWLGGADLAVHKANLNKSLRATWNARSARPLKSINVNLYPDGRSRTRITVQHSKLASAGEARKMKSWWSGRLDDLRAMLESEHRPHSLRTNR